MAATQKNALACFAMTLVSLDLSLLVPATFEETGLPRESATAAENAVEVLQALRTTGQVGFLDLPDDTHSARAIMDYVREIPGDIDTMVVLGMGGSSLGPQALYSALAPGLDGQKMRTPEMPRRLLFCDNSDPVSFRALLDSIEPQRTLFNVVTKSGGTAETAAQLMVVLDFLRSRLGDAAVGERLVATTDPSQGAMRALVDTLSLTSFPIPPSVGGRFSVLSAVGLLPAAVAGIDIQGLLNGAQTMRERCLRSRLADNPALSLASLLHWHHVRGGRNIVVMMPYADCLYTLGQWFRQLWAESLGKAGAGSTPVLSRGATDQHSQLQLYADGPDDKAYVFVTPRTRNVDVEIPHAGLTDAAFTYLAGHSMGELLDAELRGTVASLTAVGRPSAVLTLDQANEPSFGACVMLLEIATAFAGTLYGVDPFDQPGVEHAKRLVYGALGRVGFADAARQLASAPAPDPRYVF